ncbi:MAG: hypothetical protein ACYDAA_06830 [Syntrophales bacterium]
MARGSNRSSFFGKNGSAGTPPLVDQEVHHRGDPLARQLLQFNTADLGIGEDQLAHLRIGERQHAAEGVSRLGESCFGVDGILPKKECLQDR